MPATAALPDPILNLSGRTPYGRTRPRTRSPRSQRLRARGSADRPTPPSAIMKAGLLLDGFGQLRGRRQDGCGCWIYSGCYTRRATRWGATTRPTIRACRRLGVVVAGNAVLYNVLPAIWMASHITETQADLVERREWPASTFHIRRDRPAVGPFIMNAEGVARLFTRGIARRRSRALRTVRAPVETCCIRSRTQSGGAGVQGDMEVFASRMIFRSSPPPIPDRAFPLLEQARLINAFWQPQQLSRSARSWPRRKE